MSELITLMDIFSVICLLGAIHYFFLAYKSLEKMNR